MSIVVEGNQRKDPARIETVKFSVLLGQALYRMKPKARPLWRDRRTRWMEQGHQVHTELGRGGLYHVVQLGDDSMLVCKGRTHGARVAQGARPKGFVVTQQEERAEGGEVDR